MSTQNFQLNIGDKIGFVRLGNGIGEADVVTYFPVVEICERDGETAYRYQYPDGELSAAAFPHSRLSSHVIRIERVADDMICLSDRSPKELKAALKRGFQNELEVYGDWDADSFVVVNKTRRTEYRVRLVPGGSKVFIGCQCKDFKYRKQICKHIAEVLQFSFFGTGAAA